MVSLMLGWMLEKKSMRFSSLGNDMYVHQSRQLCIFYTVHGSALLQHLMLQVAHEKIGTARGQFGPHSDTADLICEFGRRTHGN